MPSRLACWLHGHDWGPWRLRSHSDLFGTSFDTRRCSQCGAWDRRAA